MCCILIRNPYLILLVKVIFICLLSFIPWPPRTVKIQCSRDSTRIVRKIIQAKLTPIFQKYNIEIPIECPLHPQRDLFLPQENAKIRHRPTQYTCGLCGKSFYEEKYLDLHFDNRHKSFVNDAEDAICLADYCDILRCDVLVTKDSSIGSVVSSAVSTDIELYNEATALAAARREVVKSHYTSNSFKLPPTLKEKLNVLLAATGHKIEIPQAKEKIHKRRRNLCNGSSKKSKTDGNENNSDKSNNTENGSNANSTCEPSSKFSRLSDIQKLKANCKNEEIHKLKTRCEQLIRTCLSGALIKLSTEDFKNMENEMNKAVCWYLTCDRYWEDTTSRPFPFALVFILVVVLSLGICLCYYIIWILFDTDESTSSYNLLTTHSNYQQPLQSSVASMHGSNLITSSLSLPHDISSNIYHPPTTSIVQSQSTQPLEQIQYSDEFNAPLVEHEQYIYVQTYQHQSGDLKKRLSDSFYNRTSRI